MAARTSPFSRSGTYGLPPIWFEAQLEPDGVRFRAPAVREFCNEDETPPPSFSEASPWGLGPNCGLWSVTSTRRRSEDTSTTKPIEPPASGSARRIARRTTALVRSRAFSIRSSEVAESATTPRDDVAGNGDRLMFHRDLDRHLHEALRRGEAGVRSYLARLFTTRLSPAGHKERRASAVDRIADGVGRRPEVPCQCLATSGFTMKGTFAPVVQVIVAFMWIGAALDGHSGHRSLRDLSIPRS
jgi:hypothetical protein